MSLLTALVTPQQELKIGLDDFGLDDELGLDDFGLDDDDELGLDDFGDDDDDLGLDDFGDDDDELGLDDFGLDDELGLDDFGLDDDELGLDDEYGSLLNKKKILRAIPSMSTKRLRRIVKSPLRSKKVKNKALRELVARRTGKTTRKVRRAGVRTSSSVRTLRKLRRHRKVLSTRPVRSKDATLYRTSSIDQVVSPQAVRRAAMQNRRMQLAQVRQGQPQGQSRRPGTRPQGQPQGQSQVRPGGRSQGQPQGQSQGRPQGRVPSRRGPAPAMKSGRFGAEGSSLTIIPPEGFEVKPKLTSAATSHPFQALLVIGVAYGVGVAIGRDRTLGFFDGIRDTITGG